MKYMYLLVTTYNVVAEYSLYRRLMQETTASSASLSGGTMTDPSEVTLNILT